MTGLNLISPHLTTENPAALLARCKHQSKRQIEVFCSQMTLPAQAHTGEALKGEAFSGTSLLRCFGPFLGYQGPISRPQIFSNLDP